ncbi:MAG: DUF4405 domain-containing protein [Deltaproteobacteria bacterium]|jgi:hypothetical protein|nr:DUF4405 domain-containing protein [Deltaproteobacteria bacterium]
MTIKLKTTFKKIIDLLMLITLTALMACQGTGFLVHEWLGTSFLAMVITHNALNARWYANLFKGDYGALRIVRTALNFLALFSVFFLVVSGPMMSQYVFSFLRLGGPSSFSRTAHLLASYWGFIFIGLHFGSHLNIFLGSNNKANKQPLNYLKELWRTLKALAILISFYGTYAFVKRELWSYMFLVNRFTFWNYEEPTAYYFLDTLAIFALCVFSSYYALKLIRKKCLAKVPNSYT